MENSMEDTDILLLLNYPNMIKLSDNEEIKYKGSIYVNGKDYTLTVTEKSDTNFIIDLPHELQHLRAKVHELLPNLYPKNIITYLDSVKTLIENRITSEMPVNHCDTYMHVLQEYFEFTKFYQFIKTCRITSDLSKITVSVEDERNREHLVGIQINYNSKDNFEVMEYDLPLERSELIPSNSLMTVYSQICDKVCALQPFFDLMENIDKNCWVLDPLEKNWRHRHRRIWIEENVSLIITVDPFNLLQLPQMKFLGPDKLLEAYHTVMNDNVVNWNSNNHIFTEILHLIGLNQFPKKEEPSNINENVLLQNGDCSICFLSRLNNKLPEVICPNSSCRNCYHVECIYEWLMSINSRRVFTQIIGQCPNCEKNISCPIPTLNTDSIMR